MSSVGVCAECETSSLRSAEKALSGFASRSVQAQFAARATLVCLCLPPYLVKIPSVLRVTAHTSTQSVVSLSACESFQGAEEFTPSLDLSVGGIGNCKDKSLQQLKSSLLCTRACGISQISQIRLCPPPLLIRNLTMPTST